MTLELRSQIAGVEVARGASSARQPLRRRRVKGTMRKMISTTASVVGERISRLPDGEWTDTRYVSGAVVGDLKPYPQPHGPQAGRPAHLQQRGHRPQRRLLQHHRRRAARLHHQLAAHLPLLRPVLCAAGLLEQVDFEFERGHDHRRPPPGRGQHLAGAGRRAGPGPAPQREAALHQGDRPPDVRDLRLLDPDLQPHLRDRPVRHADGELPARRDRRRARRLLLARRPRPRRHDELDDEPGRQRRGDRA